ncbi:MAG: hypothetical protein H0W77_06865, partial [Acidobacteria bacterium]|nr:hypothetical protein [Acidobacteriota bacterium]
MKNLRFLQFFLVVAFCLGAAFIAQAQDETMTNEEVISLTKAGLNKSLIVDKIRTSKSKFDLSTDALIKLKKAGVDDDVVAEMLRTKGGATTASSVAPVGTASGNPNDPMSPHDFGIYMFEEKNGEKTMTQLMPNVSAQNRTGGGLTAAITPFGLGKTKTKANLPDITAKLQIKEAQPVFYFYLDTKSGGLNTSSGIPSTPNEFTLI